MINDETGDAVATPVSSVADLSVVPGALDKADQMRHLVGDPELSISADGYHLSSTRFEYVDGQAKIEQMDLGTYPTQEALLGAMDKVIEAEGHKYQQQQREIALEASTYDNGEISFRPQFEQLPEPSRKQQTESVGGMRL